MSKIVWRSGWTRAATAWLLALAGLAGCAPPRAAGPVDGAFTAADAAGGIPAVSETAPPVPPTPKASAPGSSPSPLATAATLPPATPTAAEGDPFVIGRSVGGRPLEVYRFGDGPRQLLIVAGIHGGYEWNTIALADELIERLRGEPDMIPEDVTLYLLRAMNPDGEARSHGYAGRANDDGVDLNRNWPVNWHLDWDRTYCWHYLPITAGDHPLSEPETQAVMAFILDHDLAGLISYHSAALGIFPGGSPPDTASQRLAEALAEVSGYRYPPRDYGCEYTGQFADWAISQGIPAV
ncbi:MAG TPA: M14 family zinc carboxypeptidase, partial [Anaerolineales bacterium]|nr:M14 family zinc carboxypeptidase [Anaerolineales bacterium]